MRVNFVDHTGYNKPAIARQIRGDLADLDVFMDEVPSCQGEPLFHRDDVPYSASLERESWHFVDDCE